MWANLFWVWGHPEVYILIIPAFGIYSEIISTFSRRNLYGYKSMVASMVAITILSLLVWAHHFYTMGQGYYQTVSSPLQQWQLPFRQGLKYLTGWQLFEKVKSCLRRRCFGHGLYSDFLIGGVTGVMLAMASADFQYHNTMFLVAHFHYTIIPGVVYAFIAGLNYWWPKMFGFMLNEKIGKVAFWLIAIFFNVTFFPMFITGLDGQARRMFTYSEETGFGPLNLYRFYRML